MTYKTLVADYLFKRHSQLEKIHDSNTDRYLTYPIDLFWKVTNDVQIARDENWELFDYLRARAYES